MAVASCASSCASSRQSPAMLSGVLCCHSLNCGAGSKARESKAARPGVSFCCGAGRGKTSSRRAPMAASSPAMPACAWLSSSAAQASLDKAAS